MTPIVIEATAISKVGSDKAQAATNRASGKQISSAERVFIPVLPVKSGLTFSLLHCAKREGPPAPRGWLHPDVRSDGPRGMREHHFRQDLQYALCRQLALHQRRSA
jgi:hypothetical protein